MTTTVEQIETNTARLVELEAQIATERAAAAAVLAEPVPARVDHVGPAGAELEAARGRLAELEDRVRAGAAEVTAANLAAAAGAVRHAELKAEAARGRTDADVIAARHRGYRLAAAQAAAASGADAVLLEAFKAVREAARALYALAEARRPEALAAVQGQDAAWHEAERRGELGVLRAAGIYGPGDPVRTGWATAGWGLVLAAAAPVLAGDPYVPAEVGQAFTVYAGSIHTVRPELPAD